MSIFGLLFIAASFAIRGRGARAISILRGYGIGAAVYLGIVVLVSLFSPRRVLSVGDP